MVVRFESFLEDDALVLVARLQGHAGNVEAASDVEQEHFSILVLGLRSDNGVPKSTREFVLAFHELASDPAAAKLGQDATGEAVEDVG